LQKYKKGKDLVRWRYEEWLCVRSTKRIKNSKSERRVCGSEIGSD